MNEYAVLTTRRDLLSTFGGKHHGDEPVNVATGPVPLYLTLDSDGPIACYCSGGSGCKKLPNGGKQVVGDFYECRGDVLPGLFVFRQGLVFGLALVVLENLPNPMLIPTFRNVLSVVICFSPGACGGTLAVVCLSNHRP